MDTALRSTTAGAPTLDAGLGVATTVFYAAVLIAPWHAGVAAVGFLIAAVSRRWERPSMPSPASSAFVVVTALVVASAFLPLLVNPVGGHGVKLLAQFSLLPAIAALCWTLPRSGRLTASLWAGMTAGALLAGVTAIVQVAVLGISRAVGTEGNAIVFGNVALLMGALSVTLAGPATTWLSIHRPGCERYVALATISAGVGGTVASLLSGSRGGWLAVPVLGFLVLRERVRAAGEVRSPVRPSWSSPVRTQAVRVVVGTLVVAIVVLAARGMPVDRLDDAVDDIVGYVTGEAPERSTASAVTDPAGTTIGARFEAWRAAADAAADHPLLGIGWGNLQSHFVDQVAVEGRHDRITEFTHAHQQLLGTWASSGIVGAAAFGALVLVPAAHFRRAARSAPDDERAIGTAGLVVVVGFVVFGLTESIFENLVPVLFYAVTVGVLSSQLRPDVASDASVAARVGNAAG